MSKDFFSITFLILLFDLIFFENNIIYINNVSVYNFYTTIKNKAWNCTAVQRRTAMKLDHLISELRKRIDAKFKKSTGRLSAAESSSDMEKKKGNERMLVRFAPSSLFRDTAPLKPYEEETPDDVRRTNGPRTNMHTCGRWIESGAPADGYLY